MDYYEQKNIIYIMIFSILFIILYFHYICLVVCYLIKNYKRKKLCVFWIDYCALIITAIIFIIIYITNLFNKISEEKERINNPISLSKNFFSNSIIVSLCIMCYTIIDTLLFDAITAFQLGLKMKKITALDAQDLNSLSNKLSKLVLMYMKVYKIKFPIF